MSKFMRAFRRGEKGFTLIELLVVIGILGVIAGVVVLNIGRFIGSGHDQAACTELHNVQTAVIAQMVDEKLTVVPTGTPVLTFAAPSSLTTAQGSYDWIGDAGQVTQTGYASGAACKSAPVPGS